MLFIGCCCLCPQCCRCLVVMAKQFMLLLAVAAAFGLVRVFFVVYETDFKTREIRFTTNDVCSVKIVYKAIWAVCFLYFITQTPAQILPNNQKWRFNFSATPSKHTVKIEKIWLLMSGCHEKKFYCEKANKKNEISNSNGLLSSMRFMNIKCLFFVPLEISTFVPYHLSLVVFVRLSRKKVPMSNRRNRKTVQSPPFFSLWIFFLLFLLGNDFCSLRISVFSCTRLFFSFNQVLFFDFLVYFYQSHWCLMKIALNSKIKRTPQTNEEH